MEYLKSVFIPVKFEANLFINNTSFDLMTFQFSYQITRTKEKQYYLLISNNKLKY